MAFPGTYNFSYYKGDTLEFNVYPKSSDGSIFYLTDFDAFSFVAARQRGATGDDLIICEAEKGPDDAYLICRITPTTGLEFLAGVRYEYDIQISDGVDKVYTILNGEISVTEQISPNPVAPAVVLPSPPTGLTATQGVLDNKISITLNWTAPAAATGVPAPTGYKVSVSVPNPVPGGNPIEVPVATLGNVLTYTANSVTIPGVGTFDITPGSYTAKVTSVAASGDSATSATDAIVITGPVTNLRITNRTLNSATVAWTAPAGATVTSYIAALDDNPSSSPTPQDFVPILTPIDGNALEYTFTELLPGNFYGFAITPLNGTDAGRPQVVFDSLGS